MKSIILSACVFAFTSAALVAAEPPKGPAVDTSFLKLYAETRGFMLGRPVKPKVAPDGKTVLFLRAEAKTPKMKLFEFDVVTGKTKELLSPESLLKGADENLTPEEKARRERQRVSVGGFADFHLDPTGNRVLVKLSNSLFVLERTTGKVTELKTGKDGAIVDPKWSPDGKLIGFVRGFDVYAYDLAAEKETAVTTGGTQVKTNGLAEFVAQEEMGRSTGFWWSPDSKSIAYEEADHTGVEQWFVADPLKPEVPPSPQYYPRPGKKNVSVRLGVKKLAGGDTVWVEWDRNKWEYMVAVQWDKKIGLAAQLQDRKQQIVGLGSINETAGTWSPLFTEKTTTWLNINKEPKALSGNRMLWISDRDGDSRLYVVDWKEKGAIFNAITPKSLQLFELTETAQANNDPLAVVQATDNPTGSDPWMVFPNKSDGGPPSTFLRGFGPDVKPGIRSMTNTPDFIVRATIITELDSMPQMATYHEGLGASHKVPSVAIDPSFKPHVKVAKVGDFWTAVVRPRNFDPAKKYPVVVDVYGGPKHLHVVQAMRNWLVPQWLADQGFIVVAIDNRGTPGRGAEWEKAIYKKFGTVPLEDQVKGLHALCDKFPEMDRERVGIVGWSFGGYMAANGVLRRPDVFKAAVAGAPVTDWEDYDTHYTERYLGLLPESKAAYDEASLIPLAKNLKRPLLLVHGTADDNVYYRHTLKLSDALFRAGREFETLALPGITHMYSADPVVMERLWAKTAGFFQKHLGEPK